jgi:hypothetical protein
MKRTKCKSCGKIITNETKQNILCYVGEKNGNYCYIKIICPHCEKSYIMAPLIKQGEVIWYSRLRLVNKLPKRFKEFYDSVKYKN